MKTPTYRIETMANFSMGAQIYYPKDSGKPSIENAKKLLNKINESFLPGNVNGHLSEDFIAHISRIKIINQITGATVADYSEPSFMVA